MAAVLLLAPALGLLANVVAQMALSRLNLPLGPVRLQFVSFALGALVALLLLAGMLSEFPIGSADKAGYLAEHLLIYACFGFCFFNVISANVSSLRVRIVKELLAQDPTPMADATLQARYSAREMLLARLARLEAGGQIENRGGRYYLRKRGIAMIGGLFDALRRLLLKA